MTNELFYPIIAEKMCTLRGEMAHAKLINHNNDNVCTEF